MFKTVSITARVSFSATVEGDTMEEIEEKAQEIFENEPLENFIWDDGEYEILDDDDEEVE